MKRGDEAHYQDQMQCRRAVPARKVGNVRSTHVTRGAPGGRVGGEGPGAHVSRGPWMARSEPCDSRGTEPARMVGNVRSTHVTRGAPGGRVGGEGPGAHVSGGPWMARSEPCDSRGTEPARMAGTVNIA